MTFGLRRYQCASCSALALGTRTRLPPGWIRRRRGGRFVCPLCLAATRAKRVLRPEPLHPTEPGYTLRGSPLKTSKARGSRSRG